MSSSIPPAHNLPCPDCGAAVASDALSGHECERERLAEHQLERLRPEIGRFEWDFRLWLGTPEGRFELFWAEYDRGRS